jgi:ATP-dependent Clp protease ATP-binding subunit ClpA
LKDLTERSAKRAMDAHSGPTAPFRVVRYDFQMRFARSSLTALGSYCRTLIEKANFERFSDRSRRVLANAKQEAIRRNHDRVDTEHLLLGILAESDATAVTILRRLSCDLGRLRSDVEERMASKSGSDVGRKLSLTPAARQAIRYAVDEARAANSSYTRTEHLLIGLLRQPGAVGAAALTSAGVSATGVRAAISKVGELPSRSA